MALKMAMSKGVKNFLLSSMALGLTISSSCNLSSGIAGKNVEKSADNNSVVSDQTTKEQIQLQKRNTIVIIADEFNPFFSSPYGHPYVKTPNLQWMSDNGTTYENAYTPCPLCFPSRTSFLTGLRVHETQAYENTHVGISTDYPNYGSVLSGQGVYTAYIGRIDAYRLGTKLGFSEVIDPGDRKIPGNIATAKPKLHREALYSSREDPESSKPNGYEIRSNARKGDEDDIQKAQTWINTKGYSLEKPWVLTVGVFAPHYPQTVKQQFWDMYKDHEDLPEYGSNEASANHPYALDLRAYYGTDYAYDEDTTRKTRRAYYADITQLDDNVGQLLETLRKKGMLESTNIIFTSDHGEMLGKFGMWRKNSLYEDSVRIPMIAVGPDFKAGARVKTPVDLHDINASFFASTGAKRPENWAGSPLQSIPENDSERVVFSEYHGHGTRASGFMIRKGDWKFNYYFNAPNQLFNLKEDPDELNNLIDKNPEKAKELEKELRKICDPDQENLRSFKFFNDVFIPEKK